LKNPPVVLGFSPAISALSPVMLVLSKNPVIVSAESLFFAESVNDYLTYIFDDYLLAKLSKDTLGISPTLFSTYETA